MPQHRCFWPRCQITVPASRLGCPPHWYSLPADIRGLILAEYRPGQTITTCTPGYLEALEAAIEYATHKDQS